MANAKAAPEHASLHAPCTGILAQAGRIGGTGVPADVANDAFVSLSSSGQVGRHLVGLVTGKLVELAVVPGEAAYQHDGREREGAEPAP